jgi:hypothetical protein
VSHIPQRKEKDCLNCGTIVHGHYCHECGQENVVPKETFWHMVTHFFYDITHFDSKFFETVKDLLFKPGFLSMEYSKGRRASYLHPVKMYVFTSAIFFLLFFSILKPEGAFSTNLKNPLSPDDRAQLIRELKQDIKSDSLFSGYQKQIDLLLDTSRVVTQNDLLPFSDHQVITFSGTRFKTREAYDSAQRALPSGERDGWFERRLVAKEFEINEKYGANPDEGIKKLGESVLHRLPYMLFISLPLFALLLKLVYIRRKEFYYADHGVFTIHLYVFSFLVLIVVFALDKLNDVIHWGKYISIPIILLMLSQLFYLYKAMRNFYGQRRAKTFFKFLLVAFTSLMMMLVLFLFFLFFSAFTL